MTFPRFGGHGEGREARGKSAPGARSDRDRAWPFLTGEGEIRYERYDSVVDGRVVPREEYAASNTVDDALAWIAATDEPWLAYVGFHAAHATFHTPPEHLITADLSQPVRPRWTRGPTTAR